MKKTFQGLLVLFIVIFLAGSLTRNIFSYKDKLQFRSQLQAEHDKEKSLNKNLKSDLEKSSDYYYIEKHIRERLNLLKEDEISIIIPDITPSPTPAPYVEKPPHEQWYDLVVKRQS